MLFDIQKQKEGNNIQDTPTTLHRRAGTVQYSSSINIMLYDKKFMVPTVLVSTK